MKKYSWYRKLFIQKRTTKGFPKFISKTDETRVQNMKHVLINKEKFIVTEKLDGSSGTYILVKNDLNIFQKIFGFKKYEFIVCSRNMRKGIKFDNSSWWIIAKQYDIENKLKSIIDDNKYICIQGEIIGYNIQKNKYKLENGKFDFYCFNFITPKHSYSAYDVESTLKNIGIKTVPLIDDNYILPDKVDEIVKYSINKSKLYNTQREGIVVRNKSNTISFKVINPEFLLKNNE